MRTLLRWALGMLRHLGRYPRLTVTGVIDGRARRRPGRLMAVQAGSATSTRLRGNKPNAYNCITVADGCAPVTVRVWEGDAWVNAAPT